MPHNNIDEDRSVGNEQQRTSIPDRIADIKAARGGGGGEGGEGEEGNV